MTRLAYPVTLIPEEEGGFVVRFRDLPEAITQGENVKECLSEASDCLEEAIAFRIGEQLEIPEPSTLEASEHEHLVPVPWRMAWKAEVYRANGESGVTRSFFMNFLRIVVTTTEFIMSSLGITYGRG